MDKQGKTIYQTARFTTNYTGEEVAELIHKSVDSIRDYESGRTIPPDDVVNDLVELYQTPWLAYLHLKINNEVGKKHLPDVPIRQLSSSILDLQVHMNYAAAVQIDIAEVGRDNLVDKHEEPKWSNCKEILNSLAGSLFSVLFSPIQKEKTAHKRAAI